MSDVTKHDHGAFCWAELATTDQAAAKDFYSKLFGWAPEDVPIGEGQVYTMFKLHGQDAAAAMQMGEEQAAMAPPHWNCYVNVDDVEAITEKARAAGGTVMMEPFDVMDAGRMSVVADPTGAVISFWQAGNSIGSSVVKEPGATNWFELMTTDIAAATAFYTEVLGWKHEESDMPTGAYTVFSNNDVQIAGMMAMPEMRPAWGLYFETTDVDESIGKVTELGGKVLAEPQSVENVGRFAFVTDPQGAAFGLLA